MYKTKVINLYGGPGTGKCLEKNTEVLMFDGSLRKASDINIGDVVMGPDSKPRKIADIERGTAPLFRITAKNGHHLDVTANHILPLVHSGKKNSRHDGQRFNFTVKEYLDLPKSWKEKLKLFFSDSIDFLETPVPIHPYILGCWLGDGSKDSTRICGADSEPFKYMTELLKQYDCHFKVKHYKNGPCLDYSIVSNDKNHNQIRRALKTLKVWNNKHIPQMYLVNSKENRLQLLAGLIDTDGHFCSKSKAYDICSKDEQMAKQIKYLAQSLGYYAHITTKNNADQNGTCGTYYSISIIGSDLNKVPCKIPRKQALERTINKKHLRSGFSIAELGIGEYVGLIIEESAPDKLFLLHNFLVTHNSTTAAEVFAQMKKNKMRSELVREFVKDWAYEGKKIEKQHQIKLFAEQATREGILYGKVEWVVTDSPLILSEIYEARYFGKAIMTDNLYERWLALNSDVIEPIHVHIRREKEYDPVGRYETEDQAKEMDTIIYEHVYQLCQRTNSVLYTVDYSTATEEILRICKEIS